MGIDMTAPYRQRAWARPHRRGFMRGLVGAGALVLSRSGRAAGDPAAPPDGQTIEQAFREAMKDDWETVGHRVATAERLGPCCLLEARPRGAGYFAVRCEVGHDPAVHKDRGERERYTWFLAVGERGARRRHARGVYGSYTYPFACVGDSVTFPVSAHPMNVSHRFFPEPFEPRETDVREKLDRASEPSADGDAPPPAARAREGPKVTVGNDAEEHLALLRASSDGMVSRGGDFALFYIAGVFEARKPGRFNVRVTAPAESAMRLDGLSVVIVGDDAPLRTLATRADRVEYKGKVRVSSTEHVEPGTLFMRQGDRLGWTFWVQKVPTRGGRTPDVKHPPFRVERTAFKPRPWPFDHEFLADARRP